MLIPSLLTFLVQLAFASLPSSSPSHVLPDIEIEYEEYELQNGLKVVLHQDRSDPMVAVNVYYHVGSAREGPGKTGFAHLFEHLMFTATQHVEQDRLPREVLAAGGTLNGGTGFDMTFYYQVVPSNALEMALWLESERMGFLLPAVTTETFLSQQGVVQNEKRQTQDNRPYGHSNFAIASLLYPEGHPYGHPVLGSFEDLANASVADAREFFETWYGPSNATLSIAGDFDEAQLKEWIDKYFGELLPSEPVPTQKPMRVTLGETKRAFHEDDFARSPELWMVFPVVEHFVPDAYALDILAQLFSEGKNAPLAEVIVEEKKLAPDVEAFSASFELAGEFRVRVRAFPGTSLTDVERAVHEAFARFEEEGVTQEDLDRVKARMETSFYERLASVRDKSLSLARYREFAGSAGFLIQDLRQIRDVSADDLDRVFDTYIRGKPFVLTSFVPKGRIDLAAEGSERIFIPEAPPGFESAATGADVEKIDPIPSSFDRTMPPSKPPLPPVRVPAMWSHIYKNGLRLLGMTHRELPLIRFSVTVPGVGLAETPDRAGIASLMSDLMMEGTAERTPEELQKAIDEIGATISLQTDRQSLFLDARGMSATAPELARLAEEILLKPRWDVAEFERIMAERLELLNRRQADPSAVARNVFGALAYGEANLLGKDPLGITETAMGTALSDVTAFYGKTVSPSGAFIAIAGDVTKEEAVRLFQPLGDRWAPKEPGRLPSFESGPKPGGGLFFVDLPGSLQSQVYVGHRGLPRNHPDHFPLTVANHPLGGSHNSVLNLILREEKGFTYRARSVVSGGLYPGTFLASSSVMSSATREALEIVRDEIQRFREGITAEALGSAKQALTLSNARRFETTAALVDVLRQIGTYGLPHDFLSEEEAVIHQMTLEQHRALAQKHINPERMIYLVVGDAATQLDSVRDLGLGEPRLLDIHGRPVKTP